VHGQRRVRLSEYGTQLRRDKSNVVSTGTSERQFSNYYKEAARLKGATGENLLQLLERSSGQRCIRVWGFGSTRAESRQLVSHKGYQRQWQDRQHRFFLVSPGERKSLFAKRPRNSCVIWRSLELAAQRGSSEWLKWMAAKEGRCL